MLDCRMDAMHCAREWVYCSWSCTVHNDMTVCTWQYIIVWRAYKSCSLGNLVQKTGMASFVSWYVMNVYLHTLGLGKLSQPLYTDLYNFQWQWWIMAPSRNNLYTAFRVMCSVVQHPAESMCQTCTFLQTVKKDATVYWKRVEKEKNSYTNMTSVPVISWDVTSRRIYTLDLLISIKLRKDAMLLLTKGWNKSSMPATCVASVHVLLSKGICLPEL